MCTEICDELKYVLGALYSICAMRPWLRHLHMFIRPSARKKHFKSHRYDLYERFLCRHLLKFVDAFKIWLKSDKNSGHSTWKPTKINNFVLHLPLLSLLLTLSLVPLAFYRQCYAINIYVIRSSDFLFCYSTFLRVWRTELNFGREEVIIISSWNIWVFFKRAWPFSVWYHDLTDDLKRDLVFISGTSDDLPA